jgi:hypothetical protein
MFAIPLENKLEIQVFKKEAWKDMLAAAGMFIFAIILVFYMPRIVRDASFLILFLLFWRSERDYFFFGFFFIIINTPGYFFDIFTLEARYRLPIYTILPGMSLSVIDLFVIIAFLKTIYKKRLIKFTVLEHMPFFLIIVTIFGILAALWFGTSVGSFLNTIRAFFYMTLIFSFAGLLNNKLELLKFGYISIPFLFFIFFTQVFYAITGNLFISFFDPAYEGLLMLNTISGDVRPEVTGVLLVFYSFLFGFIINRNKSLELFPTLSNLIVLVAALCILLSSTRIWITIFILVYLVHLYFSGKLFKSAILVPYAGLLVFAAMIALNLTDYFIRNIWSRYYSFIESLFSNKIASYDTFESRVDYSLPKVLEAIEKSPILGIGFSDQLSKFHDSDLGGLNTVMTIGLVGTVLFFLVYFSIIQRIFFNIKNSTDYLTVTILQTVICGFIGMFLGFFTTWDFFSFFLGVNVFFLSIFLGHAELSVRFQEELVEEETEFQVLTEANV